MEKEKVSNRQLFSLMAMFTGGSSLIIVAGSLTSIAKQDAWIATIAAILFGLLFIWMYTSIGNFFPDKTYVEIIHSILGKWLGGIFIIGFLFFCLLTASQLMAYNSYFIITHFLPETPVILVAIVMVTAQVVALLYGIETIARAVELFIIFISILFILTILLVSPKINFENLFPVLEKGILPVAKGTLLLSSFITWPLAVANMMFFSKSSNHEIAKKSIFKGYLWGSFLVFLAVIMPILVLGTLVSSISAYPAFLLAKEINIEEVLTRLEGIVAGAWIITLFFKTLLYLYGLVVGLSQFLRLKDHKRIVIPFCMLAFVFSFAVYPNTNYMVMWDTTAWVLISFIFGGILPALLLILHAIKKRGKKIKIKNV